MDHPNSKCRTCLHGVTLEGPEGRINTYCRLLDALETVEVAECSSHVLREATLGGSPSELARLIVERFPGFDPETSVAGAACSLLSDHRRLLNETTALENYMVETGIAPTRKEGETVVQWALRVLASMPRKAMS